MLAATLASVSATVRCSPWWSASVAWIVTSNSPPPTPMTSTEPMVTAAVRPAVRPTAPRPISAAADQSSVRRPSARSSRADTRPATMLPAANAATCSPPVA